MRCVEFLSELLSAAGSDPRPPLHNSFQQLLAKDRGEFMLAVEGAEILGMATVSYSLAMRYGGEYCQPKELIVTPLARDKNTGGLLVQQSINNARARGRTKMGLYLLETTEHNRPFYAKYGFEVVGTEMRRDLAG